MVAYFHLNGAVESIANGEAIPAAIGSGGTAVNPNGVGMSYAAGQLREGIVFDGIDDSIDLGGVTPSVGSVSLWVWLNRVGSNDSYPLIYAGNDAFDGNQWSWGIYVYEGALYVIDFSAGGGINVPGTPSTGQWTHIVMVRNDGGAFKLYINGVAYSTATGVATNRVLRIAKAGSYYFSGALDEIAVWSGALSAADVRTLYQRQSPKFSGTFTSRVISVGATSPWTSLSWTPSSPGFKELPDQIGGAQNETVANYSALPTDTIMNGVVGLWHLDGSGWSGAAGEIADSSGHGHSGNAVAGAASRTNGKFAGAAAFSGSAAINVDDGSDLRMQTMTLAAWIQVAPGAGWREIVGKDNYQDPTRNYWFGLSYGYAQYGAAGRLVLLAQKDGVNDGLVAFGTTALDDARWHHVAVTTDGATARIYVDGQEEGSTSYSGILYNGGEPILIGGGSAWNFGGLIDELGIWSRALSAAEVQSLYLRGANGIRFQVRTCQSIDCSDGIWQGPDGTNQTYFSELNDNAVPADGADIAANDSVLAGLPSLSFAAFPPVNFPNARYAQYRAILESYDSAAVDGPALKRVDVGYTGCLMTDGFHYFDAQFLGSGVELSFQFGYDASNVGYDLYRDDGSGAREKLNAQTIPSLGAFGGTYSFFDATPGSGAVQYWLNDLYADSTSMMYGPAIPQKVIPDMSQPGANLSDLASSPPDLAVAPVTDGSISDMKDSGCNVAASPVSPPWPILFAVTLIAFARRRRKS